MGETEVLATWDRASQLLHNVSRNIKHIHVLTRSRRKMKTRRRCGLVLDVDGVRVVFQLGGGDDEVRDDTLKTRVLEACPVGRWCGEGTRMAEVLRRRLVCSSLRPILCTRKSRRALGGAYSRGEGFGSQERKRGPEVPPESREYDGGNGGSDELNRRPGGTMEREKTGKWKRGSWGFYRASNGRRQGINRRESGRGLFPCPAAGSSAGGGRRGDVS